MLDAEQWSYEIVPLGIAITPEAVTVEPSAPTVLYSIAATSISRRKPRTKAFGQIDSLIGNKIGYLGG